MILNLVDTITNWFKPVSDWISEHADSWFFWVGVFALALFIFGIVLSALNKDR